MSQVIIPRRNSSREYVFQGMAWTYHFDQVHRRDLLVDRILNPANTGLCPEH